MPQIKALLFDVFGTVVDWRTGVSSVATKLQKKYKIQFDSSEFADSWRAEYQPAMEEVRSGRRQFIILDELHRENLSRIKKKYQLELITEEDEDKLIKSWHQLPAWPDSPEGLKRLKKSDETCTNRQTKKTNGSVRRKINCHYNLALQKVTFQH